MTLTDSEDNPDRTTVPARIIAEAYRECLGARIKYMRAVNSGVSGAKESARRELQNAVLEFYEVIRYKLSNDSIVREWWEEKPVFEYKPVYATNEEGEILVNQQNQPIIEGYEPTKTGLQQLDSYIGATQVQTTEINDLFGKRQIVDEVPVMMDAELLINCSHALEAVADRLGYLAAEKERVADPDEAIV